MKLKVLGSSSAGNGYLLEASSGETLMIECGVKFIQVKRAVAFRVSDIVGVIISHSHKDHSSAAKEAMATGIYVYASPGTHKAMGTADYHRARYLIANMEERIGPFRVIGFDVLHDCAQPFGFLIYHPECGNVLFLTDTHFSPYIFKGLNQIIVEANYSDAILEEQVIGGGTPALLRDRVLSTHMSLETCMGLLKANDLKAVNNIVLIHLSNRNSDAPFFTKTISELTGKSVWVAEAGKWIDFNLKPF
jgi:phosphoribosyl 1,2-cyclic phosphodiesterase